MPAGSKTVHQYRCTFVNKWHAGLAWVTCHSTNPNVFRKQPDSFVWESFTPNFERWPITSWISSLYWLEARFASLICDIAYIYKQYIYNTADSAAQLGISRTTSFLSPARPATGKQSLRGGYFLAPPACRYGEVSRSVLYFLWMVSDQLTVWAILDVLIVNLGESNQKACGETNMLVDHLIIALFQRRRTISHATYIN